MLPIIYTKKSIIYNIRIGIQYRYFKLDEEYLNLNLIL